MFRCPVLSIGVTFVKKSVRLQSLFEIVHSKAISKSLQARLDFKQKKENRVIPNASLLFVRVLCAVSDDIHFAFNYIDYIMDIYSFKSAWYYCCNLITMFWESLEVTDCDDSLF